ncbi:MAG: aminodeoxychorismate lyase [Burkholderiales bacterium]
MILVNGIESQSVPAEDRGLAYGDGVFRTLRIADGVPQHWQRHYLKLARDCAALRLACPLRPTLETDLGRLAHAGDAVLKIIVTRGTGQRGYRYSRALAGNRVLMTGPLPVDGQTRSKEGVRVRRCELRLSHQPALAGVKHLNRLENVLARAEWQDDDIAEGILCDAEGWVIGGTLTNVFAASDGELSTPRLDRCGVAGVTRERILEAARQHRMICHVRRLSWSDLVRADELFLSNSVAGIWPVTQLDERRWAPGKLTRLVQQWLEVSGE